ncbi:MAG TPA: tetratricopeptide repeat protein, partial [Dehalococcoidia bacterium]|nr:tetratricopeptide repeat protein [Dehalococcoidia bacterium]
MALGDILSATSPTLILGDLGCGKTAFFMELAAALARVRLGDGGANTSWLPSLPSSIPLYLPLSNMGEGRLEELILNSFRLNGAQDARWEAVENLLSRASFLMMLDGLDQVPRAYQLEAMESITAFLNYRCQNHRVLLTCRLQDFSLFKTWFARAQTVRMREWDDAQVTGELISQLGAEGAQGMLDGLRQRPGLWELLRNPLVLSLLAERVLSRGEGQPLAKRQGEVLNALVQGLLEWPAASGRELPPGSGIGLREVKLALAQVAFWMRQQGRPSIDYLSLSGLLREVAPKGAAVRDLLHAVLDTGLLHFSDDRQRLSFWKPILADFFAALALGDRLQKGESIEPYVVDEQARQQWELPLILLYGSYSKRRDILTELIDEGEDRARVALAVRLVTGNEPPHLYRQILSISPSNVNLKMNLGVAFQSLGFVEEAMEELEEAHRLKSDRTDIITLFGKALESGGRYQEALDVYQKASALNPQEATYQRNIGVVLARLGRGQDAQDALQKSLQLFHANYADAHYELGKVVMQQGQAERALDSYRKAVELAPHQALYRFELAQAYKKLGQHSEAMEQIRLAVSLDEGFAQGFHELGLLYSLQGWHEEAVAEHQRALGIQPANASFRYHLGVSLAASGRQEEAAAQLEEAVRLDPGLTSALDQLGLIYLQERRQQDARAAFQRAVEIEPRSGDHRHNLALALAQMGDFAQAAREMEEALAIEEDNGAWQSQLGDILCQQGRPREALLHYQRALQLQPRDFYHYYSAGALCRQLGNLEESLRYLQQAITLKEDFADSYNELAQVYDRMNRPDEALAASQKAMALAPAHGE